MTVPVLLIIIAILFSLTIFFWRTGSVAKAEHPEPVLDVPLMEAKERKAVLKRLRRWKEEGKLTREEFEHVYQLCQAEWDQS